MNVVSKVRKEIKTIKGLFRIVPLRAESCTRHIAVKTVEFSAQAK